MLVDLGNLALSLAFFLTVLAVFSLSSGLGFGQPRLVDSGRKCSMAVFGMNAFAYAVLTYAFVTHDFSVEFVQRNSSTDLPLFYRFTAVWGGMDGSLLLWGTVLSLFLAIIAGRRSVESVSFAPHALIVLNLIQMFLAFLLMTYSNPLGRIFPLADEGNGLNPLLQDPGMIVHPPLLYLGFICLSVPFAFALGSLLEGRFDNEWIFVSRRWTLAGWFFLTMGMIIGGQWAYYELGWGGYWAWDPVENSSLMPWLTATAFLHSVIVQEKRNVFKIWNLTLIIVTFTLTMLGTFITRSGVLNSVHAFAESEVGPSFLVFIAIELLLAFSLLFYRLPHLETRHGTRGILCRENSFVLNNILFLGTTFSVFFGTVFPLLAEGLADRKISIQAPFFNQVNTPTALVLLCLMAGAPFVAWQKGNVKSLRRHLALPFFFSLSIGAFLYLFLLPELTFAFLGAVVYFVFHAILTEMHSVYRGGVLRFKSAPEKTTLASAVFKDRRRWGGMFVHLAVVVVFVGFIGNYFKTETSLTMQPGDRRQIGDFTLVYDQPEIFDALNSQRHSATLNLYQDNLFLGSLKPSKAFYPTSPEPTTEAAIHRSYWRDFYVSLASLNPDGSATLTVYVNPLVLLIPGSILLFLAGTLLSFTYQAPKTLRMKRLMKFA